MLLDVIRQAHEDRAADEARREEEARQKWERWNVKAQAEAADLFQKLPDLIRNAVANGNTSLLLMEVGGRSSLAELDGKALHLRILLEKEGLGDRLSVSIDNSGNWAVNNHFLLDLRKG